MNIALCLQGQPRNWLQGYEHLNREIISKYDVDVYAHTWWSEEMVGTYYDSAPWAPKNYKVETDLINKIDSLYKFKQIIYESSKTFIPNRNYNISRNHDEVFNSLNSRYYSCNKVLTLVEESAIEYDWLLISRFDIGIFSPMPDLHSLLQDKIYVSNYHGSKYIFNDNLWLFGKKYHLLFKGLYTDLDYVYNLMQNLPDKYSNQIRGTFLEGKKYLNGEEYISFFLLFNNAIDDVIQDSRFNYNLIR
jgi:hypothetical protein